MRSNPIVNAINAPTVVPTWMISPTQSWQTIISRYGRGYRKDTPTGVPLQ